MNFTEILTDKMKNAFKKTGFPNEKVMVTISNRPDLCEFQCNTALSLTKELHIPPIEIATKVVSEMEDEPWFSNPKAVMPGFINFNISFDALLSFTKEISALDSFGVEKGNGKRIVIDYGGPNVAKPLHIGHLRSAVIGESLKRILTFTGNEVIGDAHLGDWGLQIGLIIEELKEEKPDIPYFDPNFNGPYPETAPFTISELEIIYPKASNKSKEDADFLMRAQNNTLELQNGRPGYRALWKHITEVSIEDLKKNYDRLDTHFDLWKAESDAEPFIPKLLEILTEKNLLTESEGAMVVSVQEDGDKIEVPPCIIKKSDGASLYATTDLATIIDREETYHPDMILYVTDKRQALHFSQVFRVARKASLVPESTELKHIGFGTMNGKDGKPFKTRTGGVMRLETLLNDTYEAVLSKMEDRYDDPNLKDEIAAAVSLSAIKYGDLSNQASKDYNFDLDRFASFEGNTGPYILYAIVRIRSVLEKASEEGYSVDSIISDVASLHFLPEEPTIKNLLKALIRFPEEIEKIASELAPHKLCSYLHEVCELFNTFYHDVPILKESGDKVRGLLFLISLTEKILTVGIDLLGFKAPDKM